MKDKNSFSVYHVTGIVSYPEHLQNSNMFNRSCETVLFTPFDDKKVTQFSGFLPTSVSYLKKVIHILVHKCIKQSVELPEKL